MKTIDLKWKTDAFFDMWSFVHFLCGIVFGYVLVNYTNFSLLLSFIITFVCMVLWELFEYFVHINETGINIISDLIIGPIGFFFGFFILVNLTYGNEIVIGAVACIIILDAFGWKASIKRKQNLAN